MRLKKALAITGSAVLALSLAACGSDQAVKGDTSKPDAKATFSGTLAGAGATSQEQAQRAWMAQFQADNPKAQITYDAVGSGAGVKQLISGKVSFAGSDAILNDADRKKVEATCHSPAIHIPVYISPIAIVFNLQGVKDVNLDPNLIAKIFKGEITKWNDPAIVKENPGVKLPDLKITPVHRADESGTTDNFTDYLHAAAGKDWEFKPSKTWPVSGGEAADKTQGIIDTVKKAQGTIGYADASQAGDLGIVKLKAGDGYVGFSNETAAKAAEIAKPLPGLQPNDLALEIDRLPKDPQAYPLILISYAITCTQYKDPEAAKGVKAYLHFITSEQGQKLAHENAGSAPLTKALETKVKSAIDTIK